VVVDATADTLPFTGFRNGTTGLAAFALIALGLTALVWERGWERGRHVRNGD
jgi:hypothetical protein